MVGDVLFYAMTEKPVRDESDRSFSKTVLIYGRQNFVELGYFDFEEGQWSHFGENLFLLECWCYLPDPTTFIGNTALETIKLKGYRKAYFKRHS
jgi:hypothetical protein